MASSCVTTPKNELRALHCNPRETYGVYLGPRFSRKDSNADTEVFQLHNIRFELRAQTSRAEIRFQYFFLSKPGGGVSCVLGVLSIRSLEMNIHEGVAIHSKVKDLRSVAAALFKIVEILMRKSEVIFTSSVLYL